MFANVIGKVRAHLDLLVGHQLIFPLSWKRGLSRADSSARNLLERY